MTNTRPQSAPTGSRQVKRSDPTATGAGEAQESRRTANLDLLRAFHGAQLDLAANLLLWPEACLAWLDSQPSPRDHKRIAKADKVHRGVDMMTPDAGFHLRKLLLTAQAAKRQPERQAIKATHELAPELVRYLSFRVLAVGVTRTPEGTAIVTPALLHAVCQRIESQAKVHVIMDLARNALALRAQLLIANQNLVFSAGRALYDRISPTEKVTSGQEDAVSCCRQALMEAVDIWLPGKCRFPGAGSDLALSTLFNNRLKHVADEWRTQNFAIVEPRGNHLERARIAKEKARLTEEFGVDVTDSEAARSLVRQHVMTESKAREVVMLPKVTNFTALADATDGDHEGSDARSVEEICADETPGVTDHMEQADRAAIGLKLVRDLRPTDQLVFVGLRGGDMLREAAIRWIDASAQELLSTFAADTRNMAAAKQRIALSGVCIFN